MKLIPQANRDPENINKQLLKSQTSFIICVHFGNLLEGFSPFIRQKYTQITYFSFKTAYPP